MPIKCAICGKFTSYEKIHYVSGFNEVTSVEPSEAHIECGCCFDGHQTIEEFAKATKIIDELLDREGPINSATAHMYGLLKIAIKKYKE